MKKLLCAIGMFCMWGSVHAQRKLTEMAVHYQMNMQGQQNTSNYTVYIKGPYSRTELNNALLFTTTIHDAKTGSAVILKELSGQKLLIRASAVQWKERNKKYDTLLFQQEEGGKLIMGYQAQKAIAVLKDGSKITVFYTTDVIPENKEYDPMFKNLNGLPLEWEIQQGPLALQYAIQKINLNPIPASRFDIPTTGYRELGFEESKKGSLN